MTLATNYMRRAFLMAALDTKMKVMHEPFVSRSYAGDKISLAFISLYEEDLLGHLDGTRRDLYYRYHRELLQGEGIQDGR
jgi:hypothetical protein